VSTLIGEGGHARDIRADGWFGRKGLPHHRHFTGNGFYTLGINDPRVRARVAEEIGHPDSPWVHSSVIMGPDCSYGHGTHINYGVSMTRTTIGDHCTISPGVTICGDVTIGDLVLVGAGATVCDRVQIDDGATVGAGAVVLPETIIPAGETWVGVPARKVHP
jgi:carbonic anhydrase/acetyltransferase-like protein (isoleucine patch superfamily)